MTRLAHLDSLRGLAALAVIYYHVAEFAFKTNKMSYPVEAALFSVLVHWVDLGKIAVAVFFAISGFVIPYSLLKKRDNPLRHFAITRFFRLYPAYWLSIPFGIIVLHFMIHIPITVPTVAANLTMLQQFIGFQNIIGVYWTLQIELIFYILSAFLFTIGWLNQPSKVFTTLALVLCGALLISALRYWTGKALPVAIPLGLTVMFWGLLWRYNVDKRENARKLFNIATILILVALVPICLLAYNVDTGFGETWYKYTGSYVIAMAVFIIFTSRIRLTSPVLLYFGAISYSLYLFGPIGQELANIMLGSAASRLPIHLFIIIAMLLAAALSVVSYKFIETPAIAMGRRFADGVRQRRKLASTEGIEK